MTNPPAWQSSRRETLVLGGVTLVYLALGFALFTVEQNPDNITACSVGGMALIAGHVTGLWALWKSLPWINHVSGNVWNQPVEVRFDVLFYRILGSLACLGGGVLAVLGYAMYGFGDENSIYFLLAALVLLIPGLYYFHLLLRRFSLGKSARNVLIGLWIIVVGFTFLFAGVWSGISAALALPVWLCFCTVWTASMANAFGLTSRKSYAGLFALMLFTPTALLVLATTIFLISACYISGSHQFYEHWAIAIFACLPPFGVLWTGFQARRRVARSKLSEF
jgi:hypothetical protein